MDYNECESTKEDDAYTYEKDQVLHNQQRHPNTTTNLVKDFLKNVNRPKYPAPVPNAPNLIESSNNNSKSPYENVFRSNIPREEDNSRMTYDALNNIHEGLPNNNNINKINEETIQQISMNSSYRDKKIIEKPMKKFIVVYVPKFNFFSKAEPLGLNEEDFLEKISNIKTSLINRKREKYKEDEEEEEEEEENDDEDEAEDYIEEKGEIKRNKENRKDNMRRMILRSLFNIAFKKEINQRLLFAGSNKFFEILPKNFIDKLSLKNNKQIIIKKKLEDIFLDKELFPKINETDLKKLEHNSKLINELRTEEKKEIREKIELDNILSLEFGDFFQQYLESEEFKTEIKRLQNSKKNYSHVFIRNYIKFAKNFFEGDKS